MKLIGKLKINGNIKTNTGLHIGGSSTGIDIGGLDNSVIKDSQGRPYIPGSSLNGKMRSILEVVEGKYSGSLVIKKLKKDGNKGNNKDYIKEEVIMIINDETLKEAITKIKAIKKELKDKTKRYDLNVNNCNCGEDECHICRIFGIGVSDSKLSGPTRLYVRDSYLKNSDEMIGKKGEFSELEFDYTESKTENSLDRYTSKANPRTIERVPAGAIFGFELIYNIYDGKDIENLKYIKQALKLLEDDYIGGNGSRGYGKISFDIENIQYKSIESYIDESKIKKFDNLDSIVNLESISINEGKE